MALFSILGNLVVLGIVGIILFLFRKSDRSSKSLEQAKKYADRRSEEFDLYVDDKVGELKDLTVALEVQETTGKIILNRISGEVDTLSEKIEHIEELNKKVTGYNSTMDKMLNLSKELDERYSKLKKDSGYIEALDKKVKDGKKKLQSIEKNIEEITSEFIKNNNTSITKLKDEILTEATSQVKELEGKINFSTLEVDTLASKIIKLNNSYNNDSKDVYHSFKESLNLLLESHRENISKITKEGESLEEASLSELKSKIDLRSENLTIVLDDKLKLIEVENSEKISKLSMDMGNVEVVANKIQEENKLRLDSIKGQLDKQLLMLKDANSKGVLALQDEFTAIFNEFRESSLSEIDKTKGESVELLSDLNKQFIEANEYKDEIVTRYATAEDYINSELSDLKYRFENSLDIVTKELDSHEENVKAEAFKHLEDNIETYRDEIDKKFEELTSVHEKIDTVKEDVSKAIRVGKAEIDEDLKVIQSEFTSDKNKLQDDVVLLKNDLQNFADVNKSLIDQERKNFVESVTTLRESQLSLSNELYDSEKEIRSQVALQRETLIDSLYSEVNERLNSIKNELTSKINSFSDFENNIVSAKNSLEELLETNRDSVDLKVSELNDSLAKQIAEEKSTLTDFITNFNSEKDELESQIKKLKESSYHSISEKLNIFEDEYFEKLKVKENFIESETDVWQSRLKASVDKIKDESITSIVENMESVNSKVNTFKDNFTEDFIIFRQDSEAKINKLISTMQLSETRLLSESEEFKTKVNQDIVTFREQLDSINSDISTGTDTLKDNLALISAEQDRYISQTEVFSRTDKLRDDLAESVDKLTSRLSEAQEKSNFISITNEKLDSLRTLIESINNQIESVDGKRVKIESLEGRISKLLDLSDSVDEKLIRIKESEEHVGDIQLRLRELKALEDSVSLEFDRLEKKEGILTETNRAIDSGFGHIQVIENKLDILKESLNPFNNQIDNIKDKIQRVESREGKIDKAIDALSNLDTYISDVENKIVKMETDKEWIAGVETRLVQSVKNAEGQVKLMGALAQNKNEGLSKAKPSSSRSEIREIVIKLTHQGWTSDAISNSIGISVGEVELIRQISPKK